MMNNSNPMQFIMQLLQSGKTPNQLLKEMQMQNPSKFNSAMKQIEGMQRQGLTPKQALNNIFGGNNQIINLLQNFGIFSK